MGVVFKVEFLKDGSIKLTVDGEVPVDIHDATEQAFDDLAVMLGGGVKREPLAAHQHTYGHGHSHGHVHH